MSFIYLPSIKVQPYAVFGLTLYAVETVGADFSTGDVYLIQHKWFNNQFIANDFVKVIQAGDE